MTSVERETGEAILTAAADLFAERGYRGTTTRAIAERAGVNEVTLFRRFASKKGILQGLGEMWAKSMAGFAVGDIADPTDVAGTLKALARMEVDQATRFGAVSMRLAMDAAVTPEVAEVMAGGPGENREGLASYLADRQRAGVLRADIHSSVLAEGFFLLTSTLVMSRQLLGSGSGTTYDVAAPAAVDELVELYLRGALVEGVV